MNLALNIVVAALAIALALGWAFLRSQRALHMLQLDPTGRYTALSHLTFRAPPPAAMQIAAAWGDLSQCPPLDPARLWLDCTLDALRTDASDPSDCVPASDEGPLGAKLLPRRGVPLPVPAAGRCRDRVDSVGRSSHEVLVEAQVRATPLARSKDCRTRCRTGRPAGYPAHRLDR